MEADRKRSLVLCRPVIVGDDKGQLLEVILDEKEKRDPPVKPLYSFEDAPERITGLQQHLAQQRTLVLVATATRLYVFVGGKDLEPLFASYPPSAGVAPPGCQRNVLHILKVCLA